MKTVRDYKLMAAAETRKCQAAVEREREAIIRADRAEQVERSLTRELDRAHRQIDLLRVELASCGIKAAVPA